MEKKDYDGLRVIFVPMDGANIITQSSECSIISVQYYVSQYGWGECDPENVEGEIGYSYNWNRVPHGI